MEKYTIEVNKEQLKIIANCLEDVCRFACGQPRLDYTIENILRNEKDISFDEQIRRRNLAEEKLEEAKQILFNDLPKNWGCGYNSTDFIGNVYQIYKSILHRLAIDENWNNVHSAEPLESGNLGKVIVKPLK